MCISKWQIRLAADADAKINMRIAMARMYGCVCVRAVIAESPVRCCFSTLLPVY